MVQLQRAPMYNELHPYGPLVSVARVSRSQPLPATSANFSRKVVPATGLPSLPLLWCYFSFSSLLFALICHLVCRPRLLNRRALRLGASPPCFGRWDAEDAGPLIVSNVQVVLSASRRIPMPCARGPTSPSNPAPPCVPPLLSDLRLLPRATVDGATRPAFTWTASRRKRKTVSSDG